MQRIIIFISIIFTCGSYRSTAQVTVNQPFPEYRFSDIDHFVTNSASISDFKGKWLVLDYWAEWCGVCIASMPKMSKIQQELKDQVQIIMVGKYSNTATDNIRSIKKLYEKVRNLNSLKLTVAYDTALANNVKVNGMPDIFIIDPEGILKARVRSLTLESLKAIINGSIDEDSMRWLEKGKSSNYNVNYNPAIPLLLHNNGGADSSFLYRNMIIPGNPLIPAYLNKQENGRLEFLNYRLVDLYRLAYFGYEYSSAKKIYDDSISKSHYEQYYDYPILSIKDSTNFFSKYNLPKSFSYSLYYPKLSTTSSYSVVTNPSLRTKMQSALRDCFGYNVRIETKKMPFYRLVSTGTTVDKLATKGGMPYRYKPFGKYEGGQFENFPLIEAVYTAIKRTFDHKPGLKIFDETNMKDNVDITIKGGTMEDMVESLKGLGLDLILSEKDMKVLVISDPK